MALTNNDLQKFKEIVREEIDESVDLKLAPIKKDLAQIKKDGRYTRETVEVLIDRSDREETYLKRRITKIEEYLRL